MLEDLLNDIDQLQSSVEFSRRFLETLKNYRKRLVKQLEIANNTLKSLVDKGGKYQVQTVESIALSVKEDAKYILQSEIIAAVQKNREFAFPLFLNALLEVADNPELIKITVIGSGKSARIRVDIDLLGYAGSLEDWARGVVETRRQRKISRGADAEKASRIWRDKIYQKGPYYQTIKDRIEYSEKPASFWLLLDKGTTTLASDRGGTAYPSYSIPTNFVEKTKERIERQFKSQLNKTNLSTEKETSTLQEEVERGESYIALIDTLVEQISIELEKNRELYGKFSKVATYIDQNKLDDTLARIRLNLGVNVTAEGRVELSISSRRRYRPTISRLQAIVG